MRGTFDIISGI